MAMETSPEADRGPESLNLDELKARAGPFRETVKDLELALATYPSVLQSASAYRSHVAEQRDFLKWVAAFASASLLITINALRTAPPATLSTESGIGIAQAPFLVSVTAAAMYWWRVDLTVGRHLEALQHRVGVDLSGVREMIVETAALERAIADGRVDRANAAYTKITSRVDEGVRRGDLPRPRIYDSEPISLIWKGLCLTGYGVGILALIFDQLVKSSP